MLTRRPGATLAHRLDARTKLAFQAAFALAAFAHTTPRGLVVLTGLVLAALAAARTSPLRVIRAYAFALPFLLAAPLLEGVRLGAPWFDPATATPAALASYRVLLILLVAGAYVRTTPVRESRAAIGWFVPGRPGQFLGVGVALVFRFLPLLRADLRSIREAIAARLGTERPVHERMSLVALAGVERALERADRLALALRARCFAWNPTLPPLSFGWRDVPVLALACGLVLSVPL